MSVDSDFDQFPDMGALVIDFRGIMQEREDLQRELVTFLTGRQSDSGEIVALFSEGARTTLNRITQLEQEQNAIEGDMVQFAKILDGFRSIRELMDGLRRAKTAVQNSELECKNAIKTAIDRHPSMNLDDIQMLDSVREAALRVDRVKAKQEPIIVDLEQKKTAASAILEKYK